MLLSESNFVPDGHMCDVAFLLQCMVELVSLFLGSIVDVHRDFIAELLSNLLERQACRFRPPDIDHCTRQL